MRPLLTGLLTMTFSIAITILDMLSHVNSIPSLMNSPMWSSTSYKSAVHIHCINVLPAHELARVFPFGISLVHITTLVVSQQ